MATSNKKKPTVKDFGKKPVPGVVKPQTQEKGPKKQKSGDMADDAGSQ